MKLMSLLFLLLVTHVATAGQPVCDISGSLFGKKNIKVQLYRDYYGSNARLLAEDSIINQQFHLTCVVDEITPVSIVLREGKSSLSFNIILEEGKIQYFSYESGRMEIMGGKYNQLLFGYLHSGEFKKTNEQLYQLTNGDNFQSVKGTDKEWPALQLFLRKNDIRSAHLEKVAITSKDPKARLMAIILNELQPEKRRSMEIVDSLAPVLGESSYLVKRARVIDEQQTAMIKRRKEAMIGQQYIDFTANTIPGDPVRLAPIVQEHKYTLLQFWASWCGPCRKEIPLLKKLYTAYRDKGFALVSFSLDDNKTNWVKASEIEKPGWPNISDLKAFNSPIAKLYPVMGIPANVIIGKDGKIVATNLTGEELEQKINELFQ